jgi:peptidoglycan/xylan/chitin deacetylase (PgdA/CDA1 family)
VRGKLRRLLKNERIRRLTPGITPICRAVCLRFDDYHQANDIETWKETLSAYNDRGLRGVVAVCPQVGDDPLDPGHVPFLQTLVEDGWELAQHGYTHEDVSPKPSQSEFRGLPFDEQRRRIASGCDLLVERGIHPSTFVPPWHTYDEMTIRALADCGFDCLNEGRVPWVREKQGITLVPTHPPGFHPDTIAIGVLTLVGHPHAASDPMRQARYIEGHTEKLRTPGEFA